MELAAWFADAWRAGVPSASGRGRRVARASDRLRSTSRRSRPRCAPRSKTRSASTPWATRSSATADGGLTEKALHRLADGALIESVLMHYPARGRVAASGTPCASRARPAAPSAARSARPASSASGATSTVAEIVDQVRSAARRLAADGRRLTNIVFMGMGEPLLNLDRVLAAVEALNDPAPVRARRPAHHGLDLRRRARDPPADGARSAVHAGGLAPRGPRPAARRPRPAQPALAGRRGRGGRARPRRGDRPADQLRGHDDRRGQRHRRPTPRRWPSCCAATMPTSTSSR